MDKDFEELKSWLELTADEPLEAMGAFFDARIGGYEEHMAPWWEHYRWVAELLPEDVTALLDVGCGTGLELDRIFQRFPALEVTGVDLSAGMLAELRRKHGDRRLTLVCGDYFREELGEEMFDAVVTVESLHHFPAERKTGLFRKLFRALRPGGVLLECDYIAVSGEIEALAFAECRRRRERDGIPENMFVHFDTPLTLEHELAAMREAGFSDAALVGFLPGDSHTAMLRASRPVLPGVLKKEASD